MAFKDVESKMQIWLRNDPHLEYDPDTFDAKYVLTYVSRWPLVVNLVSASFCLGCSAFFHLFQIHSPKAAEIFSRLDYGGICILIMGSSYPPIMYPFSCKPEFYARNIFLAIITTTCAITFIVIMMPSMNQPKFRAFRGFLFIILGLSAGAPLVYLTQFA